MFFFRNFRYIQPACSSLAGCVARASPVHGVNRRALLEAGFRGGFSVAIGNASGARLSRATVRVTPSPGAAPVSVRRVSLYGPRRCAPLGAGGRARGEGNGSVEEYAGVLVGVGGWGLGLGVGGTLGLTLLAFHRAPS